MSLSDYAENALADHLMGTSSLTMPTVIHAKLHLGDPGEAGTSSPAVETTRSADIGFGAASGGVATASATVSWTSVSTAETYSHISLWDHPTAGNCLGSGALAASKAVNIGDDFDLTALTFTLT